MEYEIQYLESVTGWEKAETADDLCGYLEVEDIVRQSDFVSQIDSEIEAIRCCIVEHTNSHVRPINMNGLPALYEGMPVCLWGGADTYEVV